MKDDIVAKIQEKPLISAGIAFVVGVILGALIG